MFPMISATVQPGLVTAVVPMVGLSLGTIPLMAIAPFVFAGAGLVSVLVLVAREERARQARAASSPAPHPEGPFRKAA